MATPGGPGQSSNNRGLACPPPATGAIGNIGKNRGLSNPDLHPENENPGALAGATGADRKTDTFTGQYYRKRADAATALCHAIAECDPRDACQIMAAALDDLSAGMPGAPLFSYLDAANWWSDLASEPELKAYLLACWSRLSPRAQSNFLRFIERRAAA